MEVSFDCPDAVETLERLGLWADRACWRVAAPPEAVARLDAHWSQRRTIDYHQRKAGEPALA